jgi:hypothetical protein
MEETSQTHINLLMLELRWCRIIVTGDKTDTPVSSFARLDAVVSMLPTFIHVMVHLHCSALSLFQFIAWVSVPKLEDESPSSSLLLCSSEPFALSSLLSRHDRT